MTVRNIVEQLQPWLDYPGIPSREHPEGHTYRVLSPDRKTGLRMTALATLGRRAASGEELSPEEFAQLQVDDGEQQDFEQMVLGAAHDQMLADGVADMLVQSLARDAFLCFTSDPDVADLVLRGEAAAREKARAAAEAPSGSGGKRKAGSNSGRASGGTPARTRKTASTRSSTSAKPRARKTA